MQKLTETSFSTSCSQGYYNEANVKVLSADGETVSFQLSQPFQSGLDRYAVWFDNPKRNESEDFCYFRDSAPRGDIPNVFEAKCKFGIATISIYGGKDENFKHIGIDTSMIPDARCQFPLDNAFPEFNPNTRCYWEFKIDCFGVTGRRLRSEELKPESDASSCEEQSKRVDVATIQVDQKCANPETNPITIDSQNGDNVTYSVSQVWKGCNSVESMTIAPLHWLAVDFDNTTGKRNCVGKDSLQCGSFSSFTSACINGMAVIDLYASDDDMFKRDNVITVPAGCNAPDGGLNSCQYRYVLKCKPSLCDAKIKGHDPAATIGELKRNFLRSVFSKAHY
jgi:hypothetical protein